MLLPATSEIEVGERPAVRRPPEVYVSKLTHMRFEPSGMTNDADIRVAKSIVDYIFRWFGKKFLTTD
jgi:ribonucleoside-diphosphate reductase alpha chain